MKILSKKSSWNTVLSVFLASIALTAMGNSLAKSPPPPKKTESSSTEKLAPEERARIWLQNSLQLISEGEYMRKFWCQDSRALEETIYALRSFRILNGTGTKPEFRETNASFTVRIESSNESGQPIVRDWHFFLSDDQKKNNWCIKILI